MGSCQLQLALGGARAVSYRPTETYVLATLPQRLNIYVCQGTQAPLV